MPTTHNLEVSRRLIHEVVNEGHFGLASSLIAPDSVHHELREVTPHAEAGPGGLIELIEIYRFAFPDLVMTIEDEVAAGDRVVIRYRMEGTHRNLLMGIHPSGRRVCVRGIRIDRIADGRIVESWMSHDVLGMLRQIGALGALERRPAAAARQAPAVRPVSRLVPRPAPRPARAARGGIALPAPPPSAPPAAPGPLLA